MRQARHILLVASALALALAASPVLAQLGGGGRSGGASGGGAAGSLGSTPLGSGGAPTTGLGTGSTGGTGVDTGSAPGTGANLGGSNSGSATTRTLGGGAAASGSSSPPNSVSGSTLTDSTRAGFSAPAAPRISPNYLNNGLDTMNGSTLGPVPGTASPGATTGR